MAPKGQMLYWNQSYIHASFAYILTDNTAADTLIIVI